MRRKLKIVWIDDDPVNRRPESENMKKRLNVNVDYKDVKNGSLKDCLEILLRDKENIPDVVTLKITHSLILKIYKNQVNQIRSEKNNSGGWRLCRY